MNSCALLLLLGTLLHGATATLHTLRYFHTFSSQVPNFPDYILVGYVDDLQITHFDSVTKKCVPKQEWMKKITEEEPQYWETQTRIALENEQLGKAEVEIVKRRLNVTGGLHLGQNMYGCDWDDETNEIKGYSQYAFDGEDFISLDFDTGTFVAPKQQAFATKLRWERDGIGVELKNYIIYKSAEYLKKYVRNGESALKRTERPLVSLLQKSSSAPVTCHATGFYPDRALLFWTKDGDELMEDGHPEYVEPEEILPNGDGTFQTSVSLDLSSVPHEHWDRYRCVFQLSGVKDDYVTRLDRTKIMTNEKSLTALISVWVLLVAVVFVLAVVAFFLFRRFKERPTALISVWVLLVAVLVLAAVVFFSFRGFQEKSHTALISAVLAALAVLVLAVVAFVLFRGFQESLTALISALVLLVAVVFVLAAIVFVSFMGFQEESHTALIPVWVLLVVAAVLVLCVFTFILFRTFRRFPANRPMLSPHEMVELNPESD